MQAEKTKVEAIYPLNFLQQALLFHSLQEGIDQGFLRVKCVLKGKINVEAFQNAWRQNIQRHEVLRTSVHWENLEKPVQVVHREALLPFTFHDWSENSEPEQKAKFGELINSDGAESLSLTTAPVLRVFLIRLSGDKHVLLWDCHHILADGWSAAIILQDLLAFYDANCSGENEAGLPAIPSYKSYLNWVNKQDQEKSRSFWAEVLKDFEKPTLVANRRQATKSSENNFQTESLKLSEEESQKLRDFAQKNQVTLNTLIQGTWAILLSRYVDQEDIAFGTIVSGRSIDLPNAERMAGMYMNVLPLRTRLDDDEKFSDWLKSLQSQQAKIRAFEFSNLDEILHSGSSARGHLLYDTVVVFENMPLENIRGGGVSIESFESGLTSNYPLTLAVNPLREIKVALKYDPSVVPEKQVKWFFTNLSNLFEIMIENKSNYLKEIKESITHPEKINTRVQIKGPDKTVSEYSGPRNEVELQLLRTWETLLDHQPIGVTEDFFELGGTSITAIRLFTEIDKQFNRRLQPVTILKHRTIRALAELISDESKDEPWSTLVPLRASGSKPPVFCLHGGGGHVIFLKDLAKHLGNDQPVYALQKLGLNEAEPVIYDVKTMASHYLSEMRKVQPRGPYSIIGYCLSAPVAYEIALQLNKAGEECALLGIIDSRRSPHYYQKRTIKEKLLRFLKMIRANDWSFARDIFRQRLVEPIRRRWTYLFADEHSKKGADLWTMTNAILNEYTWEPYAGKVTLIATTQRQEDQFLQHMIDDWTPLAKDGLDVFVVEGNHGHIFYEPEVTHLAEQLRQCLDKANT
jgi:thioesterase domain-containing protein/acyl carrier protein